MKQKNAIKWSYLWLARSLCPIVILSIVTVCKPLQPRSWFFYLSHSLVFLTIWRAIGSLLSNLLSKLGFSLYFCPKWLNIFLHQLMFFSPYKCNPWSYHPNHWVEDALPFIFKFFNEMLIIHIVSSKVTHKKLKKLQIFNHFTPTIDFCTTHNREYTHTLCFRVNTKFLSLLIFFLWIFKVSCRFGWKLNYKNNISQSFRFFGYTNHQSCKFHTSTRIERLMWNTQDRM